MPASPLDELSAADTSRSVHGGATIVVAEPREVTQVELRGLIGSIAHIAYHLGAIRQITASARGPRGGTFPGT